MGMSDDVLATDPASGYDPGSWLLFNNVFQSLLSFPKGGSTPEPEAAKSCALRRTAARRLPVHAARRPEVQQRRQPHLGGRQVLLRPHDQDRRRRRARAVCSPRIAKIETPDAKTVVFQLKVPDATFPSKIASGAGSIVDHSRVLRRTACARTARPSAPGPTSWTPSTKTKAVFSVNSSYQGTAKVKNSGITLKFFHGDQTGAGRRRWRSGDIDVAYRGLTAKDIADLENSTTRPSKGIDVVEGTSAEVQHLVFNMNDPVVGKLAVRKAIAYLVDRDALVSEVYQSTATPLYSIVPAGITGHNTAFFDTLRRQPAARQGRGGAACRGITDKVKLTLWSTPSRYGPATDQEFEAIAKQLNASGLFDADGASPSPSTSTRRTSRPASTAST